MSLVKELQQLVQSGITVSGRVVSVSGSRVVVATDTGQLEVTALDALIPGDMVYIESGQASRKRRGNAEHIYHV